MNTVTLYKVTTTKAYMMSEQGTRFSLTPWFSNSPYYDGYDDGGREYQLPEGYQLGQTIDETPAIYNPQGEYCQILTQKNTPVLVDSTGINYLKRVSQ
jgi:hypothetical protein